MRHNQDNDHDHRNSDYDHRNERRDEEQERRWREEQRWHEDQRARRGGRPNQNYPQDRWPNFDESYDSIKNHGRPEHFDDRREGAIYPNRYHNPDREQDPRYLDNEQRERRDRMQHQDERHHYANRNQFASDRWPDDEDTHERRSRPSGDERYRDDHYRRYFEDRDQNRDSGR